MQDKKQNDSINLLDLFFYLLSKWRWFLLFATIGLVAAYAIYSSTNFTYFCSTTIIIKDPTNKAESASLSRYDNLINKVNMTNEIYRFRSHKLMKEVVRRTNTSVNYKQANRLRYLEMYGQSPVEIEFAPTFDEGWMTFHLTMLDEGNALISGINGGEDSFVAALGDTVLVNGVNLTIKPTKYLSSSWIDSPLLIEKKAVSAMASHFIANLGIRQEADAATILKLSLQDESSQRAATILNTLIAIYNEEVIVEKNQIAVNTAEFIKERLLFIAEELGGVESELEAFKKKNKFLDFGGHANASESTSKMYTSELAELQTQISVAESMQTYLTDPANDA